MKTMIASHSPLGSKTYQDRIHTPLSGVHLTVGNVVIFTSLVSMAIWLAILSTVDAVMSGLF